MPAVARILIGVVAGGAVIAAGVLSAGAQLDRTALSVGASLLAAAEDALPQSDSLSFELNGVQVDVSVSETRLSPPAAVRAGCGSRQVVTSSDADAGYALCAARLETGRATDPAIVYARRRGALTRVVVGQANGVVSLGSMFPEAGDSPGREIPSLPRPEGSRRLLSAASTATPDRFNVYSARGANAETLARSIAERLTREGWQIRRRSLSIAAHRGGERAAVVVSGRSGGATAAFAYTNTGAAQ